MTTRCAEDMRESQRPAAASPFIDRLHAFRDRLLASQQFQRFAVAFPLTRPIAHRQARAMFDLCAGFVYSQILSACVDLDLFQRLRGGPRTPQQLARDVNIPTDRLSRLLAAATSLKLLSCRRDGRYGLGMLGAALVGNPGIAAMIRHHAVLYRDLQDPVALLRGLERPTELAKFWGYAGSEESEALSAEQVAAYSALMASSQSFIAADVLDAYRFDRHQCLMDVGGGEGAFIAAAAAKYPSLKFKLFDLPAVAKRAEARLRTGAFGDRVTVHGGSFLDQRLPGGADLISLVRVVHDHDDAIARRLLAAAHDVLPVGGKLLIAEPMAGVSGAESVGSAYFGLYLLAMGTGRARTAAELAAMVRQAGFGPPRMLKTRHPMLVNALIATKQGSKPAANCV